MDSNVYASTYVHIYSVFNSAAFGVESCILIDHSQAIPTFYPYISPSLRLNYQGQPLFSKSFIDQYLYYCKYRAVSPIIIIVYI